MSPQQFSLRWNNHTKNLVQVFADQFEREQHVDVTISCQGRFLKAHKIVLGACSPYFQELFDSHESTPHPIIIMNGYSFDDVRSIVEFMYRGEVMVAETAMQRLLAAAEDLQIKGLSNVRSKRDSQSQQQQQQLGSDGEDNEGGDGGGSVCSGPSSAGARSATSSPLQGQSRRSATGQGGQFNAGDNSNANNDGSSQLRSRSNSNNFPSPDQPAVNANARQTTPAFLRRRKRARTSSYDTELKRKLRVHNKQGKADQGDDQGANGEQNSNNNFEDGDGGGDNKNDNMLMTINIPPPMLADVDGKQDDVEEPINDLETIKAIPEPEPKEKIPRPPNSFMIFANEWRRQLAGQFPNESNKEISVRLGVMWKSLAEEVKQKYFSAARRANDDHKKKYPDYHYNPKEARMRKMFKLQQQSLGHLVTTASHH